MPTVLATLVTLMRLSLVPGIVWALVSFMTWQTAMAETPGLSLSLPVDCKIGAVCSIQNYVDHDPGPGARDYTCGRLVYDGHKGTDFRLPDASWLDRGVRVLAAAPGRVAGTRNNVRDHAPGGYKPERNKNRECGNGVLIDHGGGWQTQYCHLRQGSVRVRKGDRVERGQTLGTIGLSGKTEFPHLHLSVRYRGAVIDPFIGAGAKAGCGGKGTPLWQPALLPELAYRPSGVLAAGFTDQVPTLKQIVSGLHRHDQLGRKARNLVFWVMIFGLQPGDKEVLRVIAPDGSVLVNTKRKPATKHKARWFSYSGKRARRLWPPGTYKGEYQLLRRNGRKEQVVVKTTVEVIVK